MLTRKLLQSYGWPNGHLTELALAAAEALMGIGLKRDAALVWLDGVRAEPPRYLDDPALAPLARECLRQALEAGARAEEIASSALACRS